MEVIWDGLRQAIAIILSGDREVGQITLLSLQVSATATVLSLVVGIPLGALLAFGRFPGRRLALGAAHTGMGLPPVVAGLVVTILLWRSGPLGMLNILYTPAAIVLAQWTIAVPIVTSAVRSRTPAARSPAPPPAPGAGVPRASRCSGCWPRRPACRSWRPRWPASAG